MLNTIANTKKEKYKGQAGTLYPRPCLVLHLRPANFHARAKTMQFQIQRQKHSQTQQV